MPPKPDPFAPTVPLDDLGRPYISEFQRQQLREALATIPPGKKAALLLFTDLQSQRTRAQFAANLPGSGWKVAAGAGWEWSGPRPDLWFGVEKVW